MKVRFDSNHFKKNYVIIGVFTSNLANLLLRKIN